MPSNVVDDYHAPADNSVAWCWNAAESWTGSNASGVRDTTAGFSVIRADLINNTDGQQVSHGLSKAPEFVIWSYYPPGSSFVRAYHKDLTSGSTLYLNNNDPQTSGGALVAAVDSSNLTLNVKSGNPANFTDTLYAWHSVPGYSSMGSYVGNGSNNGPFVFCGFRPAWILLKRSSDVGGDWHCFDSARGPYNPNLADLSPNSTDPEYASTGTTDVDFLSNGFKIRDDWAGFNNLGSTFIYVAFAEHPFGGSNVSPSPAR